jgi:hypothetical protein
MNLLAEIGSQASQPCLDVYDRACVIREAVEGTEHSDAEGVLGIGAIAAHFSHAN